MRAFVKSCCLLGILLYFVSCRGPAGPFAQNGTPLATVVARATSTAPSLPPAAAVTVRLELVTAGMTSPVALAAPDDGSRRLFVADQAGIIWVLQPADDGYELVEEPFLDLRAQLVPLHEGYEERGLLGLALHPHFAQNGRFFVYYSAPAAPGSDADHLSLISEFVAAPLTEQVDVASERIIMQIEQPTPAHNGGALTFGPDGLLYIGLGDGGPGHDPEQRAQDLSQLHGSILRLDVDSDGEKPYTIPGDNPFVGQAGLPEIYAFGLRNAYRISFDAAGSQLLLAGDVGHDHWEEINIVTAGGNYGWSIREGDECFTPPTEKVPRTSCPNSSVDGRPLLSPALVYDHQTGVAVVGGFVYRGTAVPDLFGRYLFGDWGWDQGQLFSTGHPIDHYGDPPAAKWQLQPLLLDPAGESLERQHILGFGQDAANELYVLTTMRLGPYGATGQLYKIVPVNSG